MTEQSPEWKRSDTVRCWCVHCRLMTDHQVTADDNIGPCVNAGNHDKPNGPERAVIPEFTYIDGGAIPAARSQQAIALARHMQALDGPNNRHDGKGNLPQRKEKSK